MTPLSKPVTRMGSRIILPALLATPFTVWIDALLDGSHLANTFAISVAARFGVVAISCWVVASMLRRWNGADTTEKAEAAPFHFLSVETCEISSDSLASLRRRGHVVWLTCPSPAQCEPPAPPPADPSPGQRSGGA